MGVLERKVALVTGAAGGIGRACAVALAREGARVFAADIDAVEAAETCKRIDGEATPIELNVTEEESWRRTIDEIEAQGCGLHILVNNAGLCIRAPFLEMELSAWRRQNAVNLEGVFLGTRAAVPLMARSGGGAIVNVSSVAGLQGVAGLSGYCATKGGVRLFTKAVALECAAAGNNIRVNSVHPGSIETAIWVKLHHGGAMPAEASVADEIMRETRDRSARGAPLGIVGAPEDVASGVVYLSSDAARFVTGSELVIDGGVSAA